MKKPRYLYQAQRDGKTWRIATGGNIPYPTTWHYIEQIFDTEEAAKKMAQELQESEDNV